MEADASRKDDTGQSGRNAALGDVPERGSIQSRKESRQMKLNLGAADRRLDGFVSIDIAEPADELVDLAGPWPWETSSVDEVFAGDVIEHIGDCAHQNTDCVKCYPLGSNLRHPLGRIHFLNELHRVLKPGARAVVETPNAARGVGYFQDPTHVSPFCLGTFKYFEHGAFAHQRLSKLYGITAAFRVIELIEMESSGEDPRERVWKIRAVLEAVK
jgi:SAM-dependent methyltransferase